MGQEVVGSNPAGVDVSKGMRSQQVLLPIEMDTDSPRGLEDKRVTLESASSPHPGARPKPVLDGGWRDVNAHSIGGSNPGIKSSQVGWAGTWGRVQSPS